MRLLALFVLLFAFPQDHDAFPPLGLIGSLRS
jgi:hypothetical protein